MTRRVPALILLFLAAAAIAAASTKYTVKSGDNLATIAKAHGVSVAALIATNHLAHPDDIAVGEELLLPDATTLAGIQRHYPLPTDFKKQVDNIKVVAGKWRFIVVHHSATTSGNVKAMDAYHRYRRHMENGLAYHFVIGNGCGMPDGQIAIGNRWKCQIKGGHLASPALNEKSIGICLVGNFNQTRPTPKQLQSLYALITYLEARCHPGKDAVRTHRQINTKPTECPGRLFPTKSLLDHV